MAKTFVPKPSSRELEVMEITNTMSEQLTSMFRVDDRHEWLRDADLTYCAARHLLLGEDVFFRSAVGYLLHQAVEKYLKTLRKVLFPKISEKKGGHNLDALRADVANKAKALDTPEIAKAVAELNTLQYWRYADGKQNKTRQATESGLESADFIVATVRTEIPSGVRFQGLHRILQLQGSHRELLLNALLRKNAKRDHWKTEVLGISPDVDQLFEKIQSL
jgi:HEPN domain-containing protein